MNPKEQARVKKIIGDTEVYLFGWDDEEDVWTNLERFARIVAEDYRYDDPYDYSISDSYCEHCDVY